ncbi:hypothetical protein SAMN05880593_1467 [Rhizobium sp. RU36D]|nr:hypothetical protein SAMN05880593_1467 [Rhizobium sp. RU36D]
MPSPRRSLIPPNLAMPLYSGACRGSRQQRLALVGRNKTTACGRGNQPGLAHIELGPVDAIVQQALAAAREKLVPLRLGEAEVIRDTFRDVRYSGFTGRCQTQDGQHQGLVIGDHGRLLQVSFAQMCCQPHAPSKRSASTIEDHSGAINTILRPRRALSFLRSFRGYACTLLQVFPLLRDYIRPHIDLLLP